jgi:hypothetical protein
MMNAETLTDILQFRVLKVATDSQIKIAKQKLKSVKL